MLVGGAVTARAVLTAVDITERYRSFRTGRPEAWAAVSRDGIWHYRREESPGTPWLVEHLPTGEIALMSGTLRAARIATADGSALAAANARGRQ